MFKTIFAANWLRFLITLNRIKRELGSMPKLFPQL
jgi:hypothetical protein